MTNAAFSPDWISRPGETIADLLEERGWEQAELATRTGFTRKHVNDLVQGRASITADSAQRLSTVLGSTPEFWLTREAQYQAATERKKAHDAFAGEAGWLNELPLAWMVRLRWVRRLSDKGAQVAEALRWFGVASVAAWRETCTKPLAAFRASEKLRKNQGAVATWLRKTEIEASAIECKAFDARGLRSALPALRALTLEQDPAVFMPRLQQACAAVGVAVVFVPVPPGCPLHGATRWLTSEKALVALSLRLKSNDQLWFSFFHEVGHILKHGKKLLFIEGMDGLDGGKEAEASEFAADLLIPGQSAGLLRTLLRPSDVKAFASELGVASGILVGRMQREGIITYAQMNELKVRYRWADEEAAG